ncbi:MAG TPA: hypothetical protein VH253_06380 [Phycisphaerae bacterium]|nr:hypothetical protein [Phycisphaerae bacterium]
MERLNARRAVRGGGVLLVAACLGQGSETRPLVISPAPEAVGVVHTVDELRGQAALDVPSGRVHLGVEAATVPANSAVMVYALFDFMKAVEAKGGEGSEALGPLTIRVVSAQMAEGLARVGLMRVTESPAPAFFTAGPLVGPPGDYEIEVCSEGMVIASAKVKAVEKESERWCQLGQMDWTGKAQVTPFKLNLEPGLPMVSPVMRAAPEGELPTSAGPTKESGDFHLAASGRTITVASWPGDFVPPQYEVLVRCFVNGERFQPPIPTEWKGIAASFGVKHLNGPYQMELRVTPEELGAKETDKLEVQFLFCPNGVRSVGRGFHVGLAVGTRMLLSNRVAIPWYKDATAPEP